MCDRLARAGIAWHRLSTISPASRPFTFDPATGAFSTGDGMVPAARLVWNRRTPFAANKAIDPDYRSFSLEENRQGMIGALRSLAPNWFPDPARLADAARKPLQLALAARDQRFAVPATLVT